MDEALSGSADARRARGPGLAGRRALFVLVVVATSAVCTRLMWNLLEINGVSVLEAAAFALAALLLIPIVLSFWTSLFGFVVQLRGGDELAPDVHAPLPDSLRPVRTAIVVPVFNEDMDAVLARLCATQRSIAEAGHIDAFDLFLLSDTMDPRRVLAEELAVADALGLFERPERLHYRSRSRNTAKKAGNIAEFCRAHGDEFRYMIVFDADSLMSARTIVRLVALMERRPDIGIVQAPPVPVNRRSLFGRAQQFAARAYGPTWAAGLAYLQGGEGNYYGHNAILRIGAFIEHCRLPVLPGEPPLGGHILSHDFIEAALMRRAGFRVYLAPDLGGSFEEVPSTLVDYGARDQRWCQGNLQHVRLLAMRGLHPISRIHLVLGVFSYVAAPLWMLLLALSTGEAIRTRLATHEYFAPAGSLFPIWRVSIERQATLLFATVMALLFIPRALAALARLFDARERALFGGSLRLVASAVCECLFSMLLAPILAFDQSKSVIAILLGKSVGWPAQSRDDRGTPWPLALRRHADVTIVGIVWAWLLFDLAPELVPWMTPVLLGMVFAVPISKFSSRASLGSWARAHGLFWTPEESSPPAVLRDAREELARIPRRAPAPAPDNALERVLRDPNARAVHIAFMEMDGDVDPLEVHALEGLVLKCKLHGPGALDDDEQRAVLHSQSALEELIASS